MLDHPPDFAKETESLEPSPTLALLPNVALILMPMLTGLNQMPEPSSELATMDTQEASRVFAPALEFGPPLFLEPAPGINAKLLLTTMPTGP